MVKKLSAAGSFIKTQKHTDIHTYINTYLNITYRGINVPSTQENSYPLLVITYMHIPRLRPPIEI